MSQTEWILETMRTRPVTPLDALAGCGCFRLAARIQELREDGHIINTEKVSSNGKQFASYHLIKEKKNGRKSNARR
jgi:hypothetical protein